MTHTLDTLRFNSIGLDEMFRHIDALTRDYKPMSYPPYNIVKVDQHNFVIEIALAGFKQDDLNVELKENQLLVQGKSTKEDKTVYMYKGISNKSFERMFTLADTVRVNEVEFVDGLLRVHLENVIPEHKKPRKLEINAKYISKDESNVAQLPAPSGTESK